MLHTLLGEAVFRAGLDRYFADNDGRAATVEDLLRAPEPASGRDLSQFARWYSQAGTPRLHLQRHWDGRCFRLRIQQPAPTNTGHSGPLRSQIPLRYELPDRSA